MDSSDIIFLVLIFIIVALIFAIIVYSCLSTKQNNSSKSSDLLIEDHSRSYARISDKLLTPIMEGQEDESNVEVKSYLSWQHISCVINEKSALDDVSGFIKSEDGILAIIGPPGCGKTTLLKILGGRMSVHPYTGHVCLDGEEYTDREIRVHIGYVPRFDSFIEYQTIREMLEFTAKMSLPDWVGNTERAGRVDTVLGQLNLFQIQNKLIKDLGSTDRRLLSIANAIVSNPAVLVIDEPVRDFDVKTSQLIMDSIKQLSKYGQIVICTFQQPRSIILRQCEQVLLLGHTGQSVYFGKLENAVSYFDNIGIYRPDQMSTGEFLLDIVTDAEQADLAEYANKYIESENYREMEENIMDVHKQSAELVKHAHVWISIQHEAFYLIRRNIMTILRNRGLFIFHFQFNSIISYALGSLLFGIVVGLIYFQLDYEYNGLYNRNGLIYITAVYSNVCGLSILRWNYERDYTSFELTGGKYRTKIYFFTWILIDIIFLRILPSFLYCVPMVLLSGIVDKSNVITTTFTIWIILVLITITTSTLYMIFIIIFQEKYAFFVSGFLFFVMMFFTRFVFQAHKFLGIVCDLSIVEAGFCLLMDSVFRQEAVYYFNPKGIGYAHKILSTAWLKQFEYGDMTFHKFRIELLVVQSLAQILIGMVCVKFKYAKS